MNFFHFLPLSPTKKFSTAIARQKGPYYIETTIYYRKSREELFHLEQQFSYNCRSHDRKRQKDVKNTHQH